MHLARELVTIAAGVLTILGALGVVAVALGPWLIAWTYWRSVQPMYPRRVRRSLLDLYVRAVRARLHGRPWSVGRELVELSAIARRENPISWSDSARLDDFARAYRVVAASVVRSLPLRLRFQVAAEREAAHAASVADILESDLDFKPLTAIPERHVLQDFLGRQASTAFLVAPPNVRRKSAFDEVRVSLRGKEWKGPEISTPSRMPDAYEGGVLRLVEQRAEGARHMAALRLHLLCERTTFQAHLGLDTPIFERSAADLHAAYLRNCSGRANALSIHLTVITVDGRVVLIRRPRNDHANPNRWNTAVNGVAEVRYVNGRLRGDVDDHGLVDLKATALRECHEELGRHVAIARDDVVIRALAVTTEGVAEHAHTQPWLIMEARSPLTFDEVARGQFAAASRAEGAFETGDEIGGLHVGDVGLAVAWLKAHASELTRAGLVTTLLALEHFAAADGLREDAEPLVGLWDAARGDGDLAFSARDTRFRAG